MTKEERAAERFARHMIRFHERMTHLAGEMQKDIVRCLVESSQKRRRLEKRVSYGGKKGRRAARRLKEMP